MELDDNEEGSVVITNVYGDFCIRKARRKRQKALVQEMFYDYATNTTLHGLSYTTKRGLTLTEKIFWLITFIISVCLCVYLINNVWIKWRMSPVIVTVSEQLVPVGKVPFPSVTICPQSKVKTTMYNYTAEKIKLEKILRENESLIELYEKDFNKFADVTNVCGYYAWSPALQAFPKNFTNASAALHISEVAPKVRDIFIYCFWRNYSYCEETLNMILTSEGLCYNINALAANEILREGSIHDSYPYLTSNIPSRNWTLEHGYTGHGFNVYPASGKENGATPDLEIAIKDHLIDRDHICNIINAGYKVYVQHPADLPQSSLYYYAILNKQVSSMALSFSILNTSETLKKYDPEIRQCYFPDERYLKYFKIYTANNCKIECLSNYTYMRCGCVGFYMPHHSSEEICTVLKSGCMMKAQEEIVLWEENEEDVTKKCRCLPACNSIDYEAEILKTDFNFKELIKVSAKMRNRTAQVNGIQYSKLEMYFKKSRFVSMRRSELFGLTDFLANIGGLLGLFLGFSFLSLAELIYFLTLRLWCTLKKDLKEEKKQRKDSKKY